MDMKDVVVDYRVLFKSVPGLYLILTPDLNIAAVNHAYAAATMTKREDILGRYLFDVFPDNPDDASADGVSNLMASLNIVLQTKQAHTMAVQKYDIRRPDGSFELRYWSPVNMPILNPKNEVVYIIHRVEDVTDFVLLKSEWAEKNKLTEDLRLRVEEMGMEIFSRAREIQQANKKLIDEVEEHKKTEEKLKESQELFSTFFYKSPVMNTITDASTRKYIDVNDNFVAFCGLKKEEIINKTALDINLVPDLNQNEKIIAELQEKGEISDTVVEVWTGDKGYRWVSTSAHRVNIGGRDCFLTAMIDVTDRMKAEEEIIMLNEELETKVRERTEALELRERKLAVQNRQLQSQNKELEQFAYVASHDLQEPLRTLTSFASLMQTEYTGKLDENADLYLNFMIQSSGRMRELVKGLLDYARIGKERELALTDCNLLMKQVLSDLSLAIDECGANIVVEPLPVLNGYATELRQLFQNLTSNAIKFRTKDRTPEIRVSATQQDDGWLFSVKDNGIGIEEKGKAKIFTIFKRLHNRDEYEGAGIGLAHCRKIISLHGGRIWVDSVPGQGSVFYFTISNLNIL